MQSMSRLSPECAACPFVEKCSNKRMVSEGYVVPSLAKAIAPIVESMIDVEELKKQMKRDLYRKSGIGVNYGA